MHSLQGRVALVTGASRGVGKGIALGLGEAGATVYLTGRTVLPGGSPGGLGDTLFAAAEEVTAAGGQGIAAPCDHTDDEQVRSLFGRIQDEQGRLDLGRVRALLRRHASLGGTGVLDHAPFALGQEF